MIDVVMIACNRYDLTKRAITSLVSHSRIKFRLTLAVDSKDTDDTEIRSRELLSDIYPGPVYVFKETDDIGVGGLKNVAVAEVINNPYFDYLYLSDNDVEFADNWWLPMVYALEMVPDATIVGGYSHPYNGTISVTPVGAYSFHEKNAVDGLSWMMRTSTWKQYGELMDNARGVRQSEDYEYCQRIRNDGRKLGVVYPHVIRNCGIVDTFGEKIPGADLVEQRGGW